MGDQPTERRQERLEDLVLATKGEVIALSRDLIAASRTLEKLADALEATEKARLADREVFRVELVKKDQQLETLQVSLASAKAKAEQNTRDITSLVRKAGLTGAGSGLGMGGVIAVLLKYLGMG
jgi:predicted RNase H-like nuclease (RuvC/YqgF family)